MDDPLDLTTQEQFTIRIILSCSLGISVITLGLLLYIFLKFVHKQEVRKPLILAFYAISFILLVSWIVTTVFRIIYVDVQYLNY